MRITKAALKICGHYALRETLLDLLDKTFLDLGGVVFQQQAKVSVTVILEEFQ